MPRSVISPVTNRAGVTSKAGLATADAGEASSTLARRPRSSKPCTMRSSEAARSSIGASRNASPSCQSMVGEGTAA